jgi:hypothetical protein
MEEIESQVDESTNDSENEELESAGSDEGLTLDDALKLVKKLRNESARRRTGSKEKDAQLAEYAEWKKSQMSEVERAKADKDEIAQERDALRREKFQTQLAKKYELDEDLADLIGGATEEEMTASAKKLASKLGKSEKSSAKQELFPSGKRKPVSTGPNTTPGGLFNSILRGDVN